MYLQQFYLGCLSHASYLVGSGGIAAVIDPQRDVGIYIEDAARHGFEIQHSSKRTSTPISFRDTASWPL